MPIYETLYILHPELSAARVKEVIEGMQKTLEESQAKMLWVEEWGLRNLAYDIQKQKRGYYVRFEYDSPPQAVRDLERVLRLSEDAMRFLSVARSAPSEGRDPKSQSPKPAEPTASVALAEAEVVAAEPAASVALAEAEVVAAEQAEAAEPKASDALQSAASEEGTGDAPQAVTPEGEGSEPASEASEENTEGQ